MSPAAEAPVKCPICGKPGHASFSPFCSRRCADIDLGRWLKGNYAIPGRPEDDVDNGPEALPDKDEPSES
ncbi:MAG: DNA gyrase inhibitor YacG [Pseudomonadota bacterium]